MKTRKMFLQTTPPSTPFDPYAVLNIDRDASDEAIQKSYKLLSRSFHPDKHAPGPSRDAAQEVFVQFKNAHDLLTDPVQRQVFDEHGHDGIAFVRRSLHSAERDPKSLYPTLAKLHQEGKSEEARLVLREALQQADVEQKDRAARMSATMEFPCTLEAQSFVGGDEEAALPELKDAHLSFSVTSSSPSPDSKWNMTVGGTTNVEKNGKGSGSGSVAVEYLPVQGTHITADVDIGDPFKFSVGTTRMLSSRTMMTASLRTIPNSNDLSMSIGSHRGLFENKLRASWALGMGSNLRFHYGLLSFTTTSDDYPTCTAKVNLGVSSFPLKLTAKHEFESGQSGYVSYAWGPMGVEVKTIFARALTSYLVWSIGVQHSLSGLTWLLQLERNDIVFRIPITICPRNSSAYWEKSILLSFISFLVDSIVRDIVESSESVAAVKKALERESTLLDADKSRRAAEQQVQMMEESALANRAREEACGGLVILKATYFVNGGESMDATIQIQFRVKENSKLQLPSTPKSHLLGFYSLATAPKGSSAKQSWYESWFPWLSSRTANDSSIAASPKLTVRYSYQGKVYETTIEDTEALLLPQEDALCLGESNVVVQ